MLHQSLIRCLLQSLLRILLRSLLCGLILLLSFNLKAQTNLEGIQVQADHMVRLVREKTVLLTGNVHVIYQGLHLTCDVAKIYITSKTVHATGQARLSSARMNIEGDELIYNYSTELGTVYNGVVQSGKLNFRGQVIHKIGVNEFEAEKGVYTSCSTCPPAWSISGSRMSAEFGGYTYISNAVLKLASLPVLWLPYLVVPIKSQRQSGLLFPTFGYSKKSGNIISPSAFFTLGRSQDVTTTYKYYSKRGHKGLLNYRYRASEASYGEFDTGFLKDKVYAKESAVFRSNSDSSVMGRWFINYRHHYELPQGFVQRTRFQLASDLSYPRDFNEDLPTHRAPAMDNRFSLTKGSPTQLISLDSSYYVNLLKANPLDSNRDAVHRMPEIRFGIVEKKILNTHALFKLDSAYTNFARTHHTYDDHPTLGTQGQFDLGIDRIRSGHRIDFSPSLSYPLQLGRFFDLNPSLSFRQSYYQLSPAPSAHRQYIRAETSLRTRVSRNIYFESPSSTSSTSSTASTASENTLVSREGIRHDFVPEITLAAIPYLNQPVHPFFGVNKDLPNFRSNLPLTDSDIQSPTGIQFDYSDRLYDRGLIGFSISNFLTRKTWMGDRADYKRIASLQITQTYDLIEAARKDIPGKPWSDMTAIFDLRLKHLETNAELHYFPYHRVINSSSRLRLLTEFNFIEFRHNRSFVITENVNVDPKTRSEGLGATMGVFTKYLSGSAGMDYSLSGEKVISWAYSMTATPPGNCWGFIFGLRNSYDETNIDFNVTRNFF